MLRKEGNLKRILGNFGLWSLLVFSGMIGYIFIYWLVFAPFASFSILRDLEIDANQKTLHIIDQNFFRHSISFSQISHLAYIRTEDPKESSGLWLVRDHKNRHAILRWNTNPIHEDEFIAWADDLAKSWNSVLIPYHDKSSIYSSDTFQEILTQKGLVEKQRKGLNQEEMIHWISPSLPKVLDEWEWNQILAGILVILIFSPFYFILLALLALLPTFLKYYLRKSSLPEKGLLQIVFKSRIFFIGIALLFAFIIGIYNSVTYVKSADLIQIQLSENRLSYSIQNLNQKTFDSKRLEGKEFWIDLLFGNPFTIWSRLEEFSKSKEVQMELNFMQVNKVRSFGGVLRFSKREEGKKEDNFETFNFDFSGLDPVVFDYIRYRISEISGIH
ncbi:MAG: hypothetical protein MH321_08115 [Leptospiraceae bacterium]|nr:hypothetical protein [Leptospiraceae bacterium]